MQDRQRGGHAPQRYGRWCIDPSERLDPGQKNRENNVQNHPLKLTLGKDAEMGVLERT